MPDEARLLAAFLLALTAAFLATPRAIAVAVRTDFHDRPVGYKGHAQPTPYLGGAAVLGGFLVAGVTLGGDFARLSPIVIVAIALWGLGTLDDRLGLPAWPRIAGEALAAIVLWSAGLGWDVFGSDPANLALSVIWIVGLVNAFNLMDNVDGAATTVGGVTAAASAVMAVLLGDVATAVLCAALCGACFGFLPYNVTNPARIFLGDGGSLSIGFVIAGSVMALSAGGVGWPLLLAALLLAGLPVVDTILVVISRARRGVPVYLGARDHMTHRLVTRLTSPRRVVVALGAAQAAVGAVAVGAVELGEGSVVAAWSIWFVVAAAAVAMLETRTWAPIADPQADAAGGPLMPADVEGDTDGGAEQPAPAGPPPSALELGVVALLVLACGLSPLLYGFYDLTVWGPIALGLLAVLLGLVVARPAAPRRRALVALGGLALLWLWSLASTRWGESSAQALVEANRWLLYAALFALLVLLLRDDRLSTVVLTSATAAVLGLVAYLVVVMLGGDGPSLFVSDRLHEPLGYANGEAGYLLLALWPLVALAERRRPWPLAGCAVGLATVVLGLVLLTQTRAAVPALAVTLVVMLTLVPGRRVRAWALLAVVAGLLPAIDPIVDVYRSSGAGPPDSDALRGAVAPLLAGAALAAATWSVAAWVSQRGSLLTRHRLGAASGIALALVAIGGLSVAVAVAGDPVAKARSEYRAFVELRPSPASGSRLSSGAGNRYDYWRVAVDQFDSHPVRGVGAGNYDRTYFLERRTTEDITQPHSLPLQLAGELGLVGLLGLAFFVAGVLAGLWRRALAARESATERGLTVAAGGMFLTWLLHTSVDWLHVIPGVTGIALCGAAVLTAPWRSEWPRGEGGRSVRRAIAVAAAVAVVVGAIGIGRSTLAEHYRVEANAALPQDPSGALRHAGDALDLNGGLVEAYYARAASHARLGDYPGARRELLDAARLEPHDFVTWGLLGDLAVRRGDHRTAHRYYGRASQLNPRDRELRRLAAEPG